MVELCAWAMHDGRVQQLAGLLPVCLPQGCCGLVKDALRLERRADALVLHHPEVFVIGAVGAGASAVSALADVGHPVP